ncbi:MAG: glycan-binding surface protein [Saprospiraceae bacterium]
MKTIKLLIYSLSMFSVCIFLCCKTEDLPNDGIPRIRYVRVTQPSSKDSLLIGAFQANQIAIIGENLQNTIAVWFNDQQANLTPTYITPTSIIVTTPSKVPTVVNNKMRLYFSTGDSLLYDFQIYISKPTLSNMDCEYGNAGDIVVINGNFFYPPLKVIFSENALGEVVEISDRILKVRVPESAKPGQITVTTNFGTVKSDFIFRDDRPKFIDSDPYEGWWNSSYVVTAPGPTDPPKISGNYIRYNKFTGAWSWNELAGGPASAMPEHSKNIPDGAILKPEDYFFKFEVNTVKPYTASIIRFNMALTAEYNDQFQWQPPIDTKGIWRTISIPFEEVVAKFPTKPSISPEGYWCRLLMQGPGDLDADICFDNLRIVPKVIK